MFRQIRDVLGNEYGRPKDLAGEKRIVFTALADAAFDVCFGNVKTGTGTPIPPPWQTKNRPLTTFGFPAKNNKYLTRDVELDIDIGADAKDWAAIQQTEKLKPVEAELRRVEEAIAEVVSEMEYLRLREQKLRDTNESTNNRVKYFGVGTTWLLIGLWAWQIMYLRTYFRYVSACLGGGMWALVANWSLGRSISSKWGTKEWWTVAGSGMF